jgi:hypothetical protein
VTDFHPDPLEPAGGQDDAPADLLLAVIVNVHLLRDIREHLENDDTAADLLLRIAAVLAVLKRVRDRLEEAQT